MTPRLSPTETLDSLEQQTETSDEAQYQDTTGLKLKPSNTFNINPGQSERQKFPTYINAQEISGRSDLDIQMQGEVEIRRGDTLIKADRIDYYQPKDLAKAYGHVYINRAGNRFLGSELEMQLDAMDGYMLNPTFYFLKGNGEGKAARMQFLNERQAVASKVTFSTCKRKPGPDWVPDWFMRADQIRFDQDENEGVATNGLLLFYGVPIMGAPSFSFPLNSERHSGFLPPTFALNNLGGIEMSLPYYWNIAPNRDATITATPMTQRGVLFSLSLIHISEPTRPY